METTNPETEQVANYRLRYEIRKSRLFVVLLRLFLITVSVLYIRDTITDWPIWRNWPVWLEFVCLVPLPSLVIAIGVGAGRRWAAWVAIAHDALIVAYVVGFQLAFGSYTESMINFSPQPPLSGMLFDFVLRYLLAVWVVMEAIHLNRLVGFTPRAVKVVRLAALLSVGAGIASGVGMAYGIRGRYQPLIGYANAHWLTLPDDLRPEIMWVPERPWATTFSLVTGDGLANVVLHARASGYGNYRFRGTTNSEKGESAISLFYTDSFETIDDVKSGLRQLGAGNDIRCKGVSSEEAYGKNISTWTIYSPAHNATYRVRFNEIDVIPDPE